MASTREGSSVMRLLTDETVLFVMSIRMPGPASPYSCATSAARSCEDRLLVHAALFRGLLRVDRTAGLREESRERPPWSWPDATPRTTRSRPRTAAGRRVRRAAVARTRAPDARDFTARRDVREHERRQRIRDRGPAITMSCTRSPKCASSVVRSGPTRTHVPVESLKSSEMRPWNANPFDGSCRIEECRARPRACSSPRRRTPRASARRFAPVAGRDVRSAQPRLPSGRRPAPPSIPRRAPARRCARR